MHVRRRFSVFIRAYRRLKNRVKRHHRQRHDAKHCRSDIEKWKSDAPFADADFVGCKWQATRPNCERVPTVEYDCSCHGTNKSSASNKQCPHAENSPPMDSLSPRAHQDKDQKYVVPDAEIQVHTDPNSPGLSVTNQDPNHNSGLSGSFSSKHSKNTRQHKDVSRSPCQKHPNGELCTCKPSMELSTNKDERQKIKKQKKWEKQKRQWQRQASYNQRGHNYQVLDESTSDFQKTSEYEQFERALSSEHDKFQVRRSLIKKGRGIKGNPRPMPRHPEPKTPDKGHNHSHGDHSNCSCHAVVEYSRMMDKKYEEMKQEKLRKQREQELEEQEKIRQLKEEQQHDTIEVLSSSQISTEKSEKRKSKKKKKKDKEIKKSESIDETSPVASPSAILLARKTSDVDAKEVQKAKPTKDLDQTPHTHDHESCSCKVVYEYSRKMDQEHEERRRKINEKPVMDNDVNAKKEQEINGHQTDTKKSKSKSKKPIRHSSIEKQAKQTKQSHKPDCRESCSCHAVKEYTIKMNEHQQHQRKELLRSQSQMAHKTSGEKCHSVRPKSTPNEVIDKIVGSGSVQEPEFNIRIYKGYQELKGTSSLADGDMKGVPNYEVDPADVWLHPDDWTPVKLGTKGKEPDTFTLKDWDSAVSPTSRAPSSRDSSQNHPNTLPYDPERWTPLKTPKKNKGKAHVHTLNLSEWSPPKNQERANNSKSKDVSNGENIDPSSVHLDPEDWTPVKEVSTSNDTQVNRLIVDPSDWTPVKRSSTVANGSEVPHKAADIYSQYAAQFQVSLPPNGWDPHKQSVYYENHQEEYKEHGTGYLNVELWDPEKKPVPASITHNVTSDPGSMFTTNGVSASPRVPEFQPRESLQNQEFENPFGDSFLPVASAGPEGHVKTSPNPFIDDFAPAGSTDVCPSEQNTQAAGNPFADAFMSTSSAVSCPSSSQQNEVALSPNDSGCFSLGSPLSDSGFSKSFISSVGTQCDLIAPTNQATQPVTATTQELSQLAPILTIQPLATTAQPLTPKMQQLSQISSAPTQQNQPTTQTSGKQVQPSNALAHLASLLAQPNGETTQAPTQTVPALTQPNQSPTQSIPSTLAYKHKSYVEQNENTINELATAKMENEKTRAQKSTLLNFGPFKDKRDSYDIFTEQLTDVVERDEEEGVQGKIKKKDGVQVSTDNQATADD